MSVSPMKTHKTKPLLTSYIAALSARRNRLLILGKSGAGKSTITKLLLGSLTPDSGSVTINGVSVSKLNEEMAQFISVLQQKPHLFDSTVMNNIRSW